MKMDLLNENWFYQADGSCFRNNDLKFNDSIVYDFSEVVDVTTYDGIAFEIHTPVWEEIEIKVTLLPLLIGRPEFFPKTETTILVRGEGILNVQIDFNQFDYQKAVDAFLKYISQIHIELLGKSVSNNISHTITIKNICFKNFGSFYITGAKQSKKGGAREAVTYDVWLENQSEEELTLQLFHEKQAKDILYMEYPKTVVLSPKESRSIEIKAHLTERMPRGGYEEAVFLVIPDAQASDGKRMSFITVREKVHPFLIHTEDGWNGVKRKVKTTKEYEDIFNRDYLKKAREWEVPKPSKSCDYVYPAYSQVSFSETAIAWKITGEEELLVKCVDYLTGLADEEAGYLATKHSYFQFIESVEEYNKGDFKVRRACSAGWIQEAEFFIQAALVYDLVYDSKYMTPKLHKEMERIFRNYMEFSDWRLRDGDGNNFQLGEMAAGLFCAFMLEDYHWIHRFIYGDNGFTTLLGSVLYDDGIYFEEATGYMRLAGELFFQVANAAVNFGINLKDMVVPAAYDNSIIHSPWSLREQWSEDKKPFLGMSFFRFHPVTNSVRTIKQCYDGLLLLVNKQGILPSMNDGNEHYIFEVFEQAFYLFKDPKYASVIALSPYRSLLYGVEPLPHSEFKPGTESMALPSSGFGILREEDTQVILKFGPHGGYHGHFDRLSLLSYIKGDTTFHNLEYTWYGYASFLFKMWVQTSVAHNMVTVDLKMQEPSPCELVFFESNETYQAVCAETTGRWCDPPYGGQTPYLAKFPEEKCEREGKYVLPQINEEREQGSIGEYSEPVFSRRLVILLDGYCCIWDYLKSEEEHDFDCLYHPKGAVQIEGMNQTIKTERLSTDPYSAGQFITNCYWYEQKGGAELIFNNKEEVSDSSILKAPPYSKLYRAFPNEGTVVVGKYPEKEDSFTKEDIDTHWNHLEQNSKKTVSFRVKGKEARFITVLETVTEGECGEQKGIIKEVKAIDYNRLLITEQNGKVKEFMVEGMDEKEDCKIRIILKK